MIQDHGAVEAARRLVTSGDFQDGFLKLIQLGRVDLTFENILLGEQWNELFDEQVRGVAKWRLETAQSN